MTNKTAIFTIFKLNFSFEMRNKAQRGILAEYTYRR